MSRQQQYCWILLGLLITIVAGRGMLWALRPWHRISTREMFECIKNGMTRKEVEEILGVPPGDYSPGGHVGFGGGEAGHWLFDCHSSIESWAAETGKIYVQFDERGTVVRKGFADAFERSNLWTRVRFRLGFRADWNASCTCMTIMDLTDLRRKRDTQRCKNPNTSVPTIKTPLPGPRGAGPARARPPVHVAVVHARLPAGLSRAAAGRSSRTWTATSSSTSPPASPSPPPATAIPHVVAAIQDQAAQAAAHVGHRLLLPAADRPGPAAGRGWPRARRPSASSSPTAAPRRSKRR